jgi:hypothetical protein
MAPLIVALLSINNILGLPMGAKKFALETVDALIFMVIISILAATTIAVAGQSRPESITFCVMGLKPRHTPIRSSLAGVSMIGTLRDSIPGIVCLGGDGITNGGIGIFMTPWLRVTN